MGLGENIFMTAEEVMDRWGIMDPYVFIGLISFGPVPDGELRAYESDSKEPAVFEGSQDEERIDFTNMCDYENKLEPVALKFLSFKFVDVEKCELEDSDLLKYVEWARGYRQKTGQTAKQVFENMDSRNEERAAWSREQTAEGAKWIDEVYELGDGKKLKDVGTEKDLNRESSPVTEEYDEEETALSDTALDKSGRRGLKKKQIASARCRVIAELIMGQLPDLRVAQLIKSRYITELALRVDNESDNRDESKKEKPLLGEGALRDCVKDLCKPGARGALSDEEKQQEINIVVTLANKQN
jgi:hypothetical protein